MYERSAIVLEKYFGKILGLDKENNLNKIYESYNLILDQIKEYQRIIEEEESVIQRFDMSASEIEAMQSKEKKIHEINVKVEAERDELFNDLSENTSSIDQKLQKIEETIIKNNEILKELREKYIKTLIIFIERQKERNKYARLHRAAETDYLKLLKQVNAVFESFNYNHVQNAKMFIDDYKSYNNQIVEIMLKNGKNERAPFDEEVIRIAVDERSKVAKEEAILYISVYERMKKLLSEVNSNGTVRLAKSEKLLRDVSVKLGFLQAKKDYIVVFLDNERMSAMNGKRAHDKLMEEACNNFKLDIKQIDNLYELIQKETMGKATKKAYKELYNKTYLKDIQEKEKDFEEEIVNIKINMGTLINSNYWRIEGIKNVYNTFQQEVSEKFNKDLSEYSIEETDAISENKQKENKVKSKDLSYNISSGEKKDKKENNETNKYIKGKTENEGYQEVVFDEEEEEAERKYNAKNKDDYDFLDEEEDYYDDYENEDYEEEYDENDEEYMDDDGSITEEKIDQIIRNSRKGKNKKEKNKEIGLFGKLFKK